MLQPRSVQFGNPRVLFTSTSTKQGTPEEPHQAFSQHAPGRLAGGSLPGVGVWRKDGVLKLRLNGNTHLEALTGLSRRAKGAPRGWMSRSNFPCSNKHSDQKNCGVYLVSSAAPKVSPEVLQTLITSLDAIRSTLISGR
jgi:hypothetical protein